MARLSLYRTEKSNDYRYLDRIISNQLSVGGTDFYIHKYLGPDSSAQSTDSTQPQYSELDPTNIQDLLFLENRDRKYDHDIYRLRGAYNVQNLDFDLSQFGLFLSNDIMYAVVHINDMIDIMGRKLMVGDVIELPHMTDYHPLDSKSDPLKKFMQVTDANFASEGFSQTWYPHLWRIKCEPLTDSQEFKDIMKEPTDKDNYLGDYDPEKTYPPGYVISWGDKNYESIQEVPPGVTPPNEDYWKEVENGSLEDILSTYNKNLAINDAVLEEAKRQLPLSGYDTSELYIVPTHGKFDVDGTIYTLEDAPAPPKALSVMQSNTSGSPVYGRVFINYSDKYKNPCAGIRVPQEIQQLINLYGPSENFKAFQRANLELCEQQSALTSGGSGSLEVDYSLEVDMLSVTGPFGTADNIFVTADANPADPSFDGDITQNIDYRADCDPRYRYIARATPRTFGYTVGYLTGDGTAPNGLPTGSGIVFPEAPNLGDYFLRIDYKPQVLYRWNGKGWLRISGNVRTETGFTHENKSLLSGFINDRETLYYNKDGAYIPESQDLSTILRAKPDFLPPKD